MAPALEASWTTSTSIIYTTVIAGVMDRGRVLSMSTAASTTISGGNAPYWVKTGTAFIVSLVIHLKETLSISYVYFGFAIQTQRL